MSDDLATGLKRGRRWSGLTCWARGHRWCSQPLAGGVAIAMCDRCREMLQVPYIDENVIGLPPVGPETKMGPLAVVLDSINSAEALTRADDEAWRPLRDKLAARPGVSVDVLAQLAATLSRMVNPADPGAALMRLGTWAECSAIDFAVAADPGGEG